MPCHERWGKRKMRADRRGIAAAADKGAIIRTIQREAAAAGATLKNDGKGGLDPRLALKVFRRDKYTCQNEDCPDPKKDLDLDHIAGHAKEIAADPKARKNPALAKGVKAGQVDKPEALHVICAACHDAVHQRENAIEDGKKPKPMRGAAA